MERSVACVCVCRCLLYRSKQLVESPKGTKAVLRSQGAHGCADKPTQTRREGRKNTTKQTCFIVKLLHGDRILYFTASLARPSYQPTRGMMGGSFHHNYKTFTRTRNGHRTAGEGWER